MFMGKFVLKDLYMTDEIINNYTNFCPNNNSRVDMTEWLRWGSTLAYRCVIP